MSSSTTKARRLSAAIAAGLTLAGLGASAAQAGHQDLGIDGARAFMARQPSAPIGHRDGPDGYQPQLRRSEREAIVGHRDGPDGYQRQAQIGERATVADYGPLDPWAARLLESRAPIRLVGHRDGPDGYQPQLSESPQLASTSVDRGFDWSGAGLGAAIGLAFGLLAAFTAQLVRRTRVRTA